MRGFRLWLLGITIGVGALLSLQAQSPISFQGYLRTGAGPANGNFDFIFTLYDAANAGNVVGVPVQINNLRVVDGLFTVELDFGAPGAVWAVPPNRWIEIRVRRAGVGAFVALAPRVKINPTPYAWTPVGPASGDLGNNYPNPLVVGLYSKPLQNFMMNPPVVGDLLTWDGAVWTGMGGAAGGGINGDILVWNLAARRWVRMGIPPAVGNVLRWNGAAWVPTPIIFNDPAGGDLIGNYPNPMVAGIRGRPVDPSVPQTGQVLKWNGMMWAPANDLTDGNFTLPFSGGAAVGNGATFSIANPAASGEAVSILGASNSPDGIGVVGKATASSGGVGVMGISTASTGSSYGVIGRVSSNSGTGIFGEATATSGNTYGVRGSVSSNSGIGIFGEATASSGTTYGVVGRVSSTSGTGVFGDATATSGNTHAGLFTNASSSGVGVYGHATSSSGTNYGVVGRSESPQGRGVVGVVEASTGTNYGVLGRTNSSTNGWGVYAQGRLGASGTKNFQIDHPLYPETHFLNHFCAESPEPLNAYSGNVVTDARGYAVVQLPDYFEAINRDFRYQLTVIDSSEDFVQAKVVRKIQNNQFVIRTSKPFVEVSWRVEAVRNDRWVQQYGFQTEQIKPEEYQGKYLHPELYGEPAEKSIFAPTETTGSDFIKP